MAKQCFKAKNYRITISDDGELYSIESTCPENDSSDLEVMLRKVARADLYVFLEIFKSLRMDGQGYKWSRRILKEKKQKLETQLQVIEKILVN